MAAGVRLIADGPYHSRNETEEFDVVSAIVMTLDVDLARQIISPSLSQSDLRFSNQLPPGRQDICIWHRDAGDQTRESSRSAFDRWQSAWYCKLYWSRNRAA